MTTKKYSEIPARNFIFTTIILATIASWIYLFNQTHNMIGYMGLTMSMKTIPFLIIWTIMMIAMMFPAIFPMVASFGLVYITRHQNGKPTVPIWVFLTGYLIVWILFGLVAYWGALSLLWIAKIFPQIQNYAPIIIGILFILTSIYQVTPFKNACLGKCRSPMEFIRTSWRDGYKGALIMGFEHGLYCLGCCWLLFILIFPLGIMNITAMGVITIIIFAEKTFSWGQKLNKSLAIILFGIGITIILFPKILNIS